jgi:xylulokinase
VTDSRQRLVLTVDLGSGGPKVGYVTTRGEPVWWWYERAYALESVATQDAEEWWRTVVDAALRGQAEGGIDGGDVVAVAVTGQWASTVPVDASGRPVAECLMWSDTRGATYTREIFGGPVSGYAPGPLALWLRRTGGIPSPRGGDPVAHMLHLSRDRPDVAADARWFLEPVDYLTMRFTGVAAATHMSMTAAWLTDNRHLDRMSYDDRLVRTAGVDASKLPPLVPGGSVVGTVLPDVAAELGIPATAAVVTGTPDLQNAAVASGAIGLLEPHLTLGTTAWISCPVPAKKSDVVRQMASLPGLGPLSPGAYLLGNNQENAGRALEWFRETVLPEASYAEIEALAAASPAGAGGVVFTPWLTGERSPVDDKRARAGFHNVSLATSRADLARAVLEGVAYNLRWLLEGAEHFTKSRLDPIRVLGGGARMDLWCQIVADVLDRTLERVDQPLVGGLRGAGLYAGLALGDVTPGRLRSLVPVDRVFTPDPATRATYDALSSELPRLYRRQRRMFARLNGGLG